jgi:hypothetical protein
MTAKSPVPARLFVLLARTSPVGVILRRGPSDWVQLIHWDTKKDIFTPGQWFKGRIYEQRCDLSPDGQLLIYFAFKGGNSKRNPDYRNSWIALSKPPYFTALALWPVGGTWGGGGRFKDNKTIWLSINPNSEPHQYHQPQGITILGSEDYDRYGELGLRHFQYNRINWIQTQVGHETRMAKTIIYTHFFRSLRQDGWVSRFDPPYIWQKTNDRYKIVMKRLGYRLDRGMIDEYNVIDNRNDQQITLRGIGWADFDQRGRLILATEGKIFSAVVQDGELSLTELADFNAHKPESVETPDWAKKW